MQEIDFNSYAELIQYKSKYIGFLFYFFHFVNDKAPSINSEARKEGSPIKDKKSRIACCCCRFNRHKFEERLECSQQNSSRSCFSSSVSSYKGTAIAEFYYLCCEFMKHVMPRAKRVFIKSLWCFFTGTGFTRRAIFRFKSLFYA